MRDLEETARMEREAQLKRADPASVAAASGGPMSDMPPPAVPNKASTTPAPKKRKRTRWLPPGVEPVLEAQPKWSLLEEVLDEIETQMHWAPHDERESIISGSCCDKKKCSDGLAMNRRLLQGNDPRHVQLVRHVLDPRRLPIDRGS